MRICMYVMNDVTRDSRVLREAATLATAGHTVTVVGALRTDIDQASREERDGFTLVRVPVPGGKTWWSTFVRAPWRSLRPSLAVMLGALRAGPRHWPRALGQVAAIVIASPWILARALWYAVVNKLLGRPVNVGGLEYIRRWRVETLGWGRAAVAAAPASDVHHAHDMEALPAARSAARRDAARFIYDSHEIFMAWGAITRQPGWLRWIFARWERRMTREAVALVTINRALAQDLTARLSPRRVLVVHNCPPRWDPPAVPEDRIRRALGLGAGTPVVLCHGGFLPNRGLAETAAAMLEPGLEGAHLVFLGYRVHVIESIVGDPRLAGRAHYLPAVDPREVTAWVAGADVDVMAILPVDLNSYLSTQNKLFESLAAGVPVVSSDFPVRRSIVIDDPAGPLGAVCDPADPRSIATAIRSILDPDPATRAALRARCLAAAHERWNWETESARLVELYAGSAASTGTGID